MIKKNRYEAYGGIRDLAFESYLNQKPIKVLV